MCLNFFSLCRLSWLDLSGKEQMGNFVPLVNLFSFNIRHCPAVPASHVRVCVCVCAYISYFYIYPFLFRIIVTKVFKNKIQLLSYGLLFLVIFLSLLLIILSSLSLRLSLWLRRRHRCVLSARQIWNRCRRRVCLRISSRSIITGPQSTLIQCHLMVCTCLILVYVSVRVSVHVCAWQIWNRCPRPVCLRTFSPNNIR